MKMLSVVCLVCIGIASEGVRALSVQAPRVGVPPEAQWARELTSRIFGDDARWQWIGVIESGHIALVKSEKRVAVGIWQKLDVGREPQLLSASIYVVATDTDARRWLALHAKAADGWTVKPYRLTDGAWLAEHDPTGQVEISLRHGLYVATVSAKDAALVERCAKQVAAYIAAI